MQEKIKEAFQSGVENYELGLLPQAKMCFKQVLRYKPDHAKAHNVLCIILKQQGELSDALDHAKKAIESNWNEANYHNNAGGICYELQRYRHAKQYLKEAIRLNEEFPAPHTNLGNVYKAEYDWENAAKHYKRSLELNPKEAVIGFNVGLAMAKSGNLLQAEHYLKQTIHWNPNYVEAHRLLAEVLQDQERYAESRDHYKAASEIQNPTVHLETPVYYPFDTTGLDLPRTMK